MFKKFALSLSIFAASFFAFGASAQTTEVSLSYGGYTQMDATNMHDHWGGVNNAWGALTAGLNFRVNNEFWLGPSYTFSSASTSGPVSSRVAYHAIMMNGRYRYYKTNLFRLYAKAGMGVEFSYLQPRGADNYTKAYCAYQLVPVGAEFDINRDWTMFGELGYGAQGFLQFGFKLKL